MSKVSLFLFVCNDKKHILYIMSKVSLFVFVFNDKKHILYMYTKISPKLLHVP